MKQFAQIIISILLSCPLSASETLKEPIVPIPEPDIVNPEIVELGRLLFHEPKLSRDGSISCASCHSLSTGGVDRLVVSIGIDSQKGGINAPTVFNSSLNVRQFWDGRAFDLLEQAGGPILNPKEMGSSWKHVLSVLNGDPAYLKKFSRSFSDGITISNVKSATVSLHATPSPPTSRVEQHVLGSPEAITGEQLAGYR